MAGVTLTTTDAFGTSSFNAALHWSNDAAPAAGTDYYVGSGLALRTPLNAASLGFGGATLTVGDNGTAVASLIIKNANNAVVTVNGLTLNNGSIVNGSASSGETAVTVAGNGVTLGGGGGRLDSGGTTSVLTVASVVGGSGPLTVTGGGTVVLAAADTYSGVTTVAAGTLRANTAAIGNVLGNAGGVNLSGTGGRLELNYAGGVDPVAQVKSILTAGYNLLNRFSGGQIRATTLPPGHLIGYRDIGTAVPVRVTLPGDADLDGDVDFNDFAALQTAFGQSGTRFDQDDFNYDAFTDFNDSVALQTNFGQSAGDAAIRVSAEQVAAVTAFGLANAVPEPISVALLGAKGIGLVRRPTASVGRRR